MTPVPLKRRGLLDRFRSGSRMRKWHRAKPRDPGLVAPGEVAKCVGRVEAADDLEPTPFTRELAPFWLVRLESPEPRPASTPILATHWEPREETEWVWTERFAFASDAAFWLVGETGARILVTPTSFSLAWDPENVSEHPSVNGEDPHLKALLNKHGVLAEPFMGIAGKVRFYETLVRQGDRISVYGRVVEQARTVQNAYRDATKLSLCLEGAVDRPLVLSREG